MDSNNMVVLGSVRIRPRSNTVTVPSKILSEGLMAPQEVVFWGIHTDVGVCIASRSRATLQQLGCEVIGGTILQPSRVLRIPKRIFADYHADQHPQLTETFQATPGVQMEHDQPLVFATLPPEEWNVEQSEIEAEPVLALPKDHHLLELAAECVAGE